LRLGLGVTPPWRLLVEGLDTGQRPHVLQIRLGANRGASFSCPDCGKACKAHDFKEFLWRHLNFSQCHCQITAKVPHTDYSDHEVKRMTVQWARDGSGLTLLFEQAALMLLHEMPVLAARVPGRHRRELRKRQANGGLIPSGSAVHHGRGWGGKAENKVVMLPDGARWVVLKARNGGKLTDKQSAALAELEAGDFLTA